jgi:ribonuclease P protein component
VGVIVPRYGHTAVDRNTVKRRLRELARTEVLPSLPAMDVVMRAAPSAYGASFGALRDAVRQAMERLAQRTAAKQSHEPPTATQ